MCCGSRCFKIFMRRLQSPLCFMFPLPFSLMPPVVRFCTMAGRAAVQFADLFFFGAAYYTP